MRLSFYLFRSSIKTVDDAVEACGFTEGGSYVELNLRDPAPFVARAFMQINKASIPSWLAYIAPHVELEDASVIANTFNSFILFVQSADRVCALTNGRGFAALPSGVLENDFGVRTSLNSISPEQIQVVDSRVPDVSARQRRTAFNGYSTLSQFDLDPDMELISMVAGKPSDAKLAKRITGSQAACINADVKFSEIHAKCVELIGRYSSDTYRKAFPFIDNIRRVTDSAKIETLHNELYMLLESLEIDSLAVVQPNIDWIDAPIIRMSCKGKRGNLAHLDIEHVYNWVMDNFDIMPDPSEIHLIAVDENGVLFTGRYTLLQCLAVEVTIDDKRYALACGRWYELDTDFVATVESDVKLIPCLPDDHLPPIKYKTIVPKGVKHSHLESEGDYNERVASEDGNRFVCLDKCLYSDLPGRSSIELCDLFSRDREIVCVKKGNSSATLSHLFSQASVSALTINDHMPARKFLHGKVQSVCGSEFKVDACPNGDLTYVLAIAVESSRPLDELLPFFSKVTLRWHKRIIERMGFKLALARISVEN